MKYADTAFAIGEVALATIQGQTQRIRAKTQIALNNAHRSAARADAYMKAGMALASHTARQRDWVTPPSTAARVIRQTPFDRAAANYDAAVLMADAAGASAANFGGVFNRLENIRQAGGGRPAMANKTTPGLDFSGFRKTQ